MAVKQRDDAIYDETMMRCACLALGITVEYIDIRDFVAGTGGAGRIDRGLSIRGVVQTSVSPRSRSWWCLSGALEVRLLLVNAEVRVGGSRVYAKRPRVVHIVQ